MTAANGGGAEQHGIAITGQGIRFDVDWNAPATARSDGASDDPFASVIAATPDLETLAVASISRLQLSGAGTRGADGDGSLTIELGRSTPDERRVVLIEENGRYTWGIPPRNESQVRLPVEAVPGTRGYLPKAVRRVVRVIAVKTVGRLIQGAAASVAGAWDGRRHPPRLRSWTPLDYRDADARPLDPAILGRDTGEPVLLLLHGFTGSTHSTFASFDPQVVDSICDAYRGRTMAFDHPTLVQSPEKNVEWLLAKDGPLKDLAHDVPVDILAHSRGGLVARWLAGTESRLKVRSITFVATPNDGTPLCDPAQPRGILDALSNLADALPGSDVVQLVLELVRDVVLGSALNGLEGLTAMWSRGKHLGPLNARAMGDDVTLRAICADYEPPSDAGIVRTARDRAVDLYFGGVRNDLIVPTLSTFLTSGSFRIPPGNRLVLDSSRGVDHSSFWKDQRTILQLQRWLRADWPVRIPDPVPPDETDPLAEVALPPQRLTVAKAIQTVAALPARARQAAEELVGGPLPEGTPPTGDRPAVVVVPGIMGTHLAGESGIVWLDAVRLARGHFVEMTLADGGKRPFTPAGLNRCYLPLVTNLARTYDVYVAPYDWRLDIRKSAQSLSAVVRDVLSRGSRDRAVHIVAHSMGGLVARTLIATDGDLWKELGERNNGKSGRLVMLGTPHHGSFSIVLTLLGAETILKVLDAVDTFSSRAELVRVVASFPGLYQMLPHKGFDCDGDEHDQLFAAETWGPDSPVRHTLLEDATGLHETLAGAVDGDRMVCVAGYGQPTPYRVTIKERGEFSLGVTSRGDGRVAEKLGRLEGVETFFSPSSHGGLPGAKDVLEALGDLLDEGTTKTLPKEAPVSRGVDAMEAPPMIPAELFDDVPAAGVLRGMGEGQGGGDGWRTTEARLEEALTPLVGGGRRRPARVVVDVEVVHASLEQASYPVAVGHYAGLPQGGAERFLDTRLGGALRSRQALGLYPEAEGTAVYITAPPGHRPRGAFVLGLGPFGTLSAATLGESMCNAVITYALAQHEGQSATERDDLRSIGISSVLVSTPGRHGLTVESSVVALVEGVIAAVGRLQKATTGPRLERISLEIVELYEQPAEEAALAVANLWKILDPRLLREAEVVCATRLKPGDGRRPGAAPRDLTGTPWVPVRVELAEEDGHGGASDIRIMRFSPLSRRAQANAIDHDVDLATVGELIDEAIRRADIDLTSSRTLYEQLFPHRTKLDFDRSEAIHLLVDEAVAHIPWELLATDTDAGCVSPLALRAGMLRQLVSQRQTRERWRQPVGQLALVVGDPPTSLPRLPGARDEANELSDLLQKSDWEVTSLVYGSDSDGSRQEWIDIVNELYARPYRLVHIAAHGVLDALDPRRTGVQIGKGDHQRLTSLSFKQMTVTPDLVFLNCCHIGQLRPEERAPGLERPHRMAATVARELLLNGIPAVVVTGWAVDDVAARAFATLLYESMLEGRPFGEAVRRARIAARDADNGATATWGAYQCYGDPDFQFFSQPLAAPKREIVSAAQLARQLDMVAARAGNAMSDIFRERMIADVDDLLRRAGVDLLVDGAVLESLGHAYAELGDNQRAIDAYKRSLNDENGASRVRAAARLANCRARLATHLHHHPDEPRPDDAKRLFDEARDTLDWLERLCDKTAELHALRGSLEKKRATTLGDREQVADALKRARAEYCAAWDISSRGRNPYNAYHSNLRLQLTFITEGCLGDDDERIFECLCEQARKESDDPSAGYWEIARWADTLVTCAVLKRGEPEQATDEYVKAFKLRSTVRQRASAIDHLVDLTRLLPEVEARRFEELVEALKKASANGG